MWVGMWVGMLVGNGHVHSVRLASACRSGGSRLVMVPAVMVTAVLVPAAIA